MVLKKILLSMCILVNCIAVAQQKFKLKYEYYKWGAIKTIKLKKLFSTKDHLTLSKGKNSAFQLANHLYISEYIILERRPDTWRKREYSIKRYLITKEGFKLEEEANIKMYDCEGHSYGSGLFT